MNVGIWMPRTSDEVRKMKHSAGLYQAGVLEVWDIGQLHGLLARLGSTLVSLEMDTHATPLGKFLFPERPFFLIGPENGSIPREVLDLGRIVQVEAPSRYPLQPHVAGAIVLRENYLARRDAQIGTPA